ncbi:hypothetical protein FRB91_001072 [Serendipita sp. 411]|nr:hypothetical protein FRB91_001072 [Serendipita sp. 411]
MNTNAAVNAHVGVGGGLLATSSTLAAGSAGNVEFGSFTSASTSTGFSSIGTGSTSATNVPFEPTIRSRTLFFLSIRDSRAPSFHRNKRKRIDDATITGASGTKKSKEGEPFVIYDEEEEEEDDTERGRLLGSNVKSPSGHIAIDVQQGPGLPPAWVELADQVERTLQAVRGKSAYSFIRPCFLCLFHHPLHSLPPFNV